MKETPLAGRTAVVTGASRGIGLATARALGQAGARVAMLARSEQTLQREAQLIGAGATAVSADLTDAAQVYGAIERILEIFAGAPDVLVLNAGIFPLGRIGELEPSMFVASVTLNLITPYRLLHAFIPRMRQRGTGDVITIGSIADRITYQENGAYAAAKFAARALHQVLRAELAGSGVRASLVSPGPVDTPLWDPIDPDHRAGFTPRAQMLPPEAVADAVHWVATRPAGVNIDELRLTHS